MNHHGGLCQATDLAGTLASTLVFWRLHSSVDVVCMVDVHAWPHGAPLCTDEVPATTRQKWQDVDAPPHHLLRG